MATPILNIATVAASQNQKEVTINDAIAALENAGNDMLEVEVNDSNAATLTAAQWRGAGTFVLTEGAPAPDATVALTVPATKRHAIIVNTMTQNAEASIGGQSEDAVLVPAGTAVVTVSDGSNLRSAGGGGGGGASAFTGLSDTPGSLGTPLQQLRVNFGGTALEFFTATKSYDFGFAFGSEPGASEVIQRVQISRGITVPADMTGSTGTVAANPTSPYDVDVRDDGASIGTVSVSTGGTVTFATTGGTAKSVAAGSVITFLSPGSTDGTIEGLAVGIVATED